MAERRPKPNPVAIGRGMLGVTEKALKHAAGKTYEKAVRAHGMASAAARRAARYGEVAVTTRSPAVRKRAVGAARKITDVARKYSGEIESLNARQRAISGAGRIVGKAIKVTESPALGAAAIILTPKVANAGEDEWVKQRDIRVKQRQVRQIRARRGK